jgi:threonine-phosphate decarboxylase
MIQGHGGDIYAMAQRLGCRPEAIIDMSSNINPLGMPPGLQSHLHDCLHWAGALPEADAGKAIAHMAALLNVDSHRILAGNGTTQFIYTACAALNARKVLIVGPTYADYADACRMHHLQPHYFLSIAETRFAVDLERLDQMLFDFDTVFICNPNNPTGRLIACDALLALCRQHSKTHFVVDESYLPFAAVDGSQSMVACELDNLSVLWSISKIFAVPGLRAGFLIANQNTISRFRRLMQPWSLNSLAQAAVAYLGSNRTAMYRFIDETRRYLEKERARFCDAMASRTQLTLFPSETSYILMALPKGVDADDLCRHMAQGRILIRNCGNFHGLSDRYVRVALKDPEINRLACNYLAEFMENPTSAAH